LNTVKRFASSSAVGRIKARSHIAPHTKMTGGPSPSRSKAIVVPSLEVTFSIAPLSPSFVGPFLG
jgi:hypothetical protein